MNKFFTYKMIKIVFFLLLGVSCATKVKSPMNRFISPESVGGSLHSEVQLAKTNSIQGRFDVSEEQPYPIQESLVSSNSYWWALSLIDQVDIFWWHSSHSASLLGLRFQIFGQSQAQTSQGHSLALTVAIGGNEHETETDPVLDMKVSVQDYSLIYGLWLFPWWQMNSSFFIQSSRLGGELKSSSDPTINSNLDYKNEIYGATVGTKLLWSDIFLKLEWVYIQSKWSDSLKNQHQSIGAALGTRF